MSSPAATYVQGVHKKLKLFAAWPPNQPRKLGDVGRLVDGEFEFLTTLENLGIKFSQRVGPPGEDLSYTSGSSVSVQFKAEGQTLPGASIPQANAGVLVEFGASGAFVIQVAGPVLSQIDDIVSLGKQISTLFRTTESGKRQWEESWCVITELLTASKLTVLISRSATSKVELSAEAKIPIGSKAPLANVGGKLSVVSQKGEVTSALAEVGLTPMFQVSRLKRSLLARLLRDEGASEFGRLGIRREPGMPANVMEDVPLNDSLAAPVAKPESQ